MRRVGIQYESFIHFTTSYTPPNTLESEINTHQLGLMGSLHIPKPAVLLALADQLDNLRAAPPEPRGGNPEFQEGDGTKDETLKKVKLVETGDIPRKYHRSHEEKSRSRHSPTKKSPASSSHASRTWHQRLTGWGMW